VTLKKSETWLIGMAVLSLNSLGGFLIRNEAVIMACISAVVGVILIGLGAQLGDAMQKSIFYKKDLDPRYQPGADAQS